MTFYEAHNTAQRVVAASLADPNKHWPHYCVQIDPECTKDGNIWRFSDGSALTLTASGLPVESIG